MGIQDATIIPNEHVATMPKEEALARDNVLLRDMNNRQEQTIRELREQYSALAARENTHQEELKALNQSCDRQVDELVRQVNCLKKELKEKNLWLEAKDIMINAQQETIDQMNAKDRLFVKLVDDRFQKSIGDQ